MTKENIDKINNLIDKKQYDKALKIAEELLKENDKDAEIYYYIGNIYSSSKKYDKSIEYYDKTIKLNPKHKKAYNNRALSKNDIGKYYEALEDIKKALELNTVKEDLYIYYDNLGLIKSNIGEHDEAIKYFNRAIELNNKYDNVYNNRGYTYFILEKYDEAVKDFTKAIKLNNKFKWPYLNRGVTKNKLRQYNKAIKDFSKLIEIDSNYKEAYLNRGVSKFFLEKYNDAIDDFNKAIDIDIEYEEAYYYKALSYYALDNYRESLYNFSVLSKLNYDFSVSNLINLITFELNYNSILSIINLLIENNLYNDIWKNDVTLYIISKEIENIDDYLMKNIKEILLFEYLLIALLSFKSELLCNHYKNEVSIVHYTSLKTLNSLLDNNTNKLRITSITTANDRNEGKILENIFNRNNVNIKIVNDNKKSLYWVLYYNEHKNQLVFNPTNSKYKSIIINLDNIYKAELKEKEKNIEVVIKFIFRKIFEASNNINKKAKNKVKNIIFSYLFENIRYLIKHEAFFEEQELRIISINNIDSQDIKRDLRTKRLYMDYTELFNKDENYIKEIILGSKISNVQSMVEYISKMLLEKENNKLRNIKVSISKAPLR